MKDTINVKWMGDMAFEAAIKEAQDSDGCK